MNHEPVRTPREETSEEREHRILQEVIDSMTDEKIEEYRQLYKQDFNENISFDEAKEIAIRLVTLYRLLGYPLPEEEEEIKKRIKKRVDQRLREIWDGDLGEDEPDDDIYTAGFLRGR